MHISHLVNFTLWRICINISPLSIRERSGSVVECLTRDEGPRVRASPASLRCGPCEPHRRHCVVVLEQDTFILA